MTERPLNKSQKESDWKYQLMLEIIENTKKYSGYDYERGGGLPSIIPIITSHDYVS